MEDVTVNVDTSNSDIQEYIDSRTDKPPPDNKSIRSWIERCQSKDGKSDIENNAMRTNMCNIYKKTCPI